MKKRLLKDIAYEKIKKNILSGYYLDKQYTSENELVSELEMSRTPIREALQRLELEGLVKIFSNQGISIQELSIKDTKNIFDTRIAIETYSLRITMHSLQEEHIIKLDELMEKQRLAYENQDSYSFMELDSEFHHYLIELSENDMFLQIMKNIRERLFYNGHRIFRKNPNRIKQSLDEHTAVIEALKKMNVESAIQCMEIHLLNGRKTLLS